METSSQTAAENDDCRSRLRVNRDIQTPLYSPINCPTIRRNDHLPSETTEIQVRNSHNIIVQNIYLYEIMCIHVQVFFFFFIKPGGNNFY